jgi:hypothetical protein
MGVQGPALISLPIALYIYIYIGSKQNGKQNMYQYLKLTKLTSCSRAFLENLIVTPLVKKFHAFYLTGRFIAVLTRAHHWIVS